MANHKRTYTFLITTAPGLGNKKDIATETLSSFYKSHSTLNPGDAGLDLFIPKTQCVSSGSTNIIKLGITAVCLDSNNIPVHFFLLPRSSTAIDTPLRLANSVGLIDAGYRNEIGAIVDHIRPKAETYICLEGSRLFQLVPPGPVDEIKCVWCNILPKEFRNTKRGLGGMGSTGK